MGLLDDLKRQAEQVRTQENFQKTTRAENLAVVESAMEKTIQQQKVTYDFARLMDGATEIKCSEFGQEIINNM